MHSLASLRLYTGATCLRVNNHHWSHFCSERWKQLLLSPRSFWISAIKIFFFFFFFFFLLLLLLRIRNLFKAMIGLKCVKYLANETPPSIVFSSHWTSEMFRFLYVFWWFLFISTGILTLRGVFVRGQT